MRRSRGFAALAVAALLAGGGGASAAQAVGEDTAFDRLGDWFAAFGKDPAERDLITAQRKAERVAKRSADAAREGARELGDELDRAGDRLERGARGNR
jgi:hypothetical protein